MFKISNHKKEWIAWLRRNKTSKKASLLSNAHTSKFTERDLSETDSGFKKTANIKK